MRILHLIHTPRQSGAETLVHALSLRHQASGHRVGIGAFSPPEKSFIGSICQLIDAGVDVQLPDQLKKRFDRATHYINTIRRFQPDIIFGHSEIPSLYGRFSRILAGSKAPFVSVLHSATNNDFSCGSLFYAEKASGFLLNHIVSVSKEAQAAYALRFDRGAQITLIPNGIDVQRFTGRNRGQTRRRLGLKADSIVMIQVGRISPVKNQILSLESAKSYLQRNANSQLWFAGLTEDESYRHSLERKIEQLELSTQVRLLGSREDVEELLAAADCFLMPSIQEAHSVAMIEALASGIPVIAAEIPAFEFSKNYPGVHLIPTIEKDSWRAAVDSFENPGHYSRDLESFSIERTADLYLSLARQLTAKDS